MFNALYIRKCIKAQNDLQFLRTFTTERNEHGYAEMLPFSFEEGDYFHCPERMEEDEVKVVKEYSRPLVYTSEPKESFLTEKCFWIPTADQLREGMDNISYSIGNTSNMNEEQILNTIMFERKNLRWSREKGDYIKIE